MLNKITPFFKRCERKFSGRGDPSDDDSMPIEEPSPPPIQFSPASTLFKLTNHYKRGGSEIVRNSSEIKRVLKTNSENSFSIRMMEEPNEFDVSAEHVCDFIINSQTQLHQNEETGRLSFPMSQNNMGPFPRMSTDLLGFYSTQEATNSNVVIPSPQIVRQLFERGNSLQSCDSSGKLNKA